MVQVTAKAWGPSLLPCINPGTKLVVSTLTLLKRRIWGVSGIEEQFVGIWKSQGKKKPEFQMPREMNIWKYWTHFAFVSKLWVPKTPLGLGRPCWIWVSPKGWDLCWDLLCCFPKADVFQGNIYPQPLLTCGDSINPGLAGKTNSHPGIWETKCSLLAPAHPSLPQCKGHCWRTGQQHLPDSSGTANFGMFRASTTPPSCIFKHDFLL